MLIAILLLCKVISRLMSHVITRNCRHLNSNRSQDVCKDRPETYGWLASCLGSGVPWEGRQLSHVIAGVSDCDGKGEPVFMTEGEQNALLQKPLCCSAALFPKSQFPPLPLMSAQPIKPSLSS